MKRILIFLLCLCMLTLPVSAATDYERQIEETIHSLPAVLGSEKYLADESILPAGNSASDWLVTALALCGAKGNFDNYCDRLRASVTTAYEEKGGFGVYNATEWHRIALTVSALGKDPTDFGADLIADGTYNFIGEDLTAQSLNAVIYALLVLDSRDYEVPENCKYSRETLQNTILQAQNEDGSFGLMPGSSDADITAMAVQALAPYAQAADAVQNALDYLGRQLTDTGFPSGSCETVCQAVIALCSVGIDPQTDPRFVRTGRGLADILNLYRLPDGSYVHSFTDSHGNLMATEQALLSLCSLNRFYSDGNAVRLYDFSHSEPSKSSPLQNPLLWCGAGVFLMSFGASFYLTRRKKSHV